MSTIRRVQADPGGRVRLTFWPGGSAMSRRGRRKLRDTARQMWAQVSADRAEYQVAAAQVRGVQVTRGFAGTTVVAVQLADGSVQRYTSWRSRTALAAAFQPVGV